MTFQEHIPGMRASTPRRNVVVGLAYIHLLWVVLLAARPFTIG